MTKMTHEDRALFLADEAARRQITENISANIFVEASAGSGKTWSLVERMLCMVKSGIAIDQICAITFTKAAANEFRGRFQQRLHRCLQEDPLTQQERERCGYAMEHVDLCFTGTIDAFCNMILNEHPTEAGIPGNAAVGASAALQNALVREYLNAANGLYGPELEQKYRRFCLWQSRPEEVVRNAASSLMELRNTRFLYEMPKGFDVDEAYAAEKQALLESAAWFLQHPEFIYRGNQKGRDAEKAITEKFRSISGKWSGKVSDVLEVLKNLKNFQITPPGGDEAQWHPELFKRSGKKPVPLVYDLGAEHSIYTLLKEEQYAVTMDFLSSFVSACAETLQRNGELSYFDVLLRLRDMLKADAAKDGRLIRHIYERHSY